MEIRGRAEKASQRIDKYSIMCSVYLALPLSQRQFSNPRVKEDKQTK